MPPDDREARERASPSEGSVARVVASLDDPDPATRTTAAETLLDEATADAAILGTDHVSVVADALDDAVAAVRQNAARTLTRVGLDDPTKVEPHVDALAARLTDGDPAVRHRAAQALMTIARGGVAVPLDALRPALDDGTDAVRQNAARALAALADHHPGRLAGERAVVLSLLDDADARVREFAGWTVAATSEVDATWRAPPEGAATARRRWRAVVALAAVREPLEALAAAVASDPESTRSDVERFCRGLERTVLRGSAGRDA